MSINFNTETAYPKLEINAPDIIFNANNVDISQENKAASPDSQIATKIIKSVQSTEAGAYPRWLSDGDDYTFNIVANNISVDVNKEKYTLDIHDTFVGSSGAIATESVATNIANIETSEHLIVYRAKVNNTNVIRGAYCKCTLSGPNPEFEVGTPITLTSTSNQSLGVYEPFILETTDNNAYVFYSEEKSKSNQDIKAIKVTYDTNNHTITKGSPFVVVSGTNQVNDLNDIVSNSCPGFSVVKKLIDGTYLMVFENNINNAGNNYPYVIQYLYFKDPADKSTYSTVKTLFRAKNKIINCPYLAVKKDGRIIVTYHSTENYFGYDGDNAGIHKKEFEAAISNNIVTYGMDLKAKDFAKIPLFENKENEWSGGWGSVYYSEKDDKVYFLYCTGTNTASASKQKGLVIASIDSLKIPTIPLSSVDATANTIAKRSSGGYLYGATASNIEPNVNPNLLTTKKYVGNYVSSQLVSYLNVNNPTIPSGQVYKINGENMCNYRSLSLTISADVGGGSGSAYGLYVNNVLVKIVGTFTAPTITGAIPTMKISWDRAQPTDWGMLKMMTVGLPGSSPLIFCPTTTSCNLTVSLSSDFNRKGTTYFTIM